MLKTCWVVQHHKFGASDEQGLVLAGAGDYDYAPAAASLFSYMKLPSAV
jgi:hypothetical protein